MGGRDHACETCGRGGMSDYRACVCGPCNICDRANCARHRAMLARNACLLGDVAECERVGASIDWRKRALAAEAELTAARETIERLTADLATSQRFLKAEKEVVDRQGARFREVHKALGITCPGYCDDNVWGGGVVEMVNALKAERDAMRTVVEAASSVRDYCDTESPRYLADPPPTIKAVFDAIDTFRSTSKPQETTSE